MADERAEAAGTPTPLHAELVALRAELARADAPARAEIRARVKAETRARAETKVNARAAEADARAARAEIRARLKAETRAWAESKLRARAAQARAASLMPPPNEDDTVVLPVLVVDEPEPQRVAPKRRRPLSAPWILALSSLGVLLVAVGYAGGRYHWPLATAAYWVGQIVVFVPVTARLLSRRAGNGESFLLVIGLAVNQYLLKWCYSPDQLRFPDELQHWLATTIIDQTGELFRPNPALPPAVHFPGLAEMGAAVSQLTGLPVSAAGFIVAGVCHLTFVAAIYVTVLRATGSASQAGVVCVVYATSLHYLFFDSMYLYQTAALAFLMLTIWAARRLAAGDGRRFAALAVAGIVLTTVCHHVTAGVLVLTLLLLAVAEIALVRPRPWATLLLPGAGVAVVGVWILLVARDVLAYLAEPVDQLRQTVSQVLSGKTAASGGPSQVAVWQLAVQGLGLLLLLGLFLVATRETIARRDRSPWRWAALAGSVVFFAGNAVRFLGASGPEIAGRLGTFTYLPMAMVAAVAFRRAVRSPRRKDPRGRTRTARWLAGTGVVTLLMVAARAGGWPPAGQLLPGPYLADGFERATDAYGIAAAGWERRVLGSGRRTGGDLTAVSLASTYGRQDPVREAGPLFYADPWTAGDDTLAQHLGLSYLVVDQRLGRQLPVNGLYFADDPEAGRITRPLSAGQLGKFDDLPGWSRVYDNGEIRIYRVGAG